MNDNTLQLLTAMANTLGTSVEYLWEVLIKQAPITGIIDLFLIGTWIVLTVWWCRFVDRKTTVPKESDDDYPKAEWNEEGAGLAWISVGCLVLITMFVVSSMLSTTLSALLNPEYWALQQILSSR